MVVVVAEGIPVVVLALDNGKFESSISCTRFVHTASIYRIHGKLVCSAVP